MTSVFEDFTVAMIQPSKYGELLKKRKRDIVLFVVILVVVTSLATVVYPLFTMGKLVKEFYTYDVPYFKVENGEMTVEDEFEMKNEMFFIGLSDKKEYTADDVKNYNVAILADKDSFVIKNYNQVNSLKYSDFGNQLTFDKDYIYIFKNFFLFVVIFTGIILLAFNFAGFFIGAGLLKWITSGFLRAYNVEITSKEHYVLCIYSRTVPVILSALFSLMNFALPYIFSMLISIFYLRAAFGNMRENKNSISDETDLNTEETNEENDDE